MTDMGVYFEPPPRRALEKWKIVKLLAENNYKFVREGHKVLIEKFICGGKNPSYERVRETIETQKKRREENRISERKKERNFGSK
ncbi:MAG TPA: hypothetical protein VF599_20915 [Pyrinomonadaceae bacterium]|jgi:hypothetical protein